ncbi:MAG: Glycoside hydrolase family 55 protein [Aureobasidium pullulans]|uniref:DNA polymerase V n=1 Tax=Aureobasidium pullulans TaxID=5580 RepID=A0A1A7MSB1_AURPU|nr:MAG: Glycoside hydrolase family 55 protein [Aureobasidium pullulans]THW14025.1 hypothetical protein D6D24_05715 [Aureobasidium pullulans]THW26040.1 hypothetical protein D6D23_03819 [Aureobasidium pullulans]THX58837.1 hypothetical protein D6D06_02584 [Aureobasidium pullulans]THY53286.1 hypothetical protein D6C99_03873 [Aureobasidium pullulans]
MAGKRRRNSNGEDEAVHDTTHPSRKRRVEFGVADAKLAALYNDLSDDVKATRLKAAAELIRALADADPEALDKSLTRLIRGLCSSRKAARSGFSVALIEILKLTTKSPSADVEGVDLSLPAIIERIISITQPEEQSNNKERRDHLTGRCFGFKSLIQSQLLFAKGVSITEWEKVLDHIFKLATETTWLRRECGVTLYETLATLTQIEDLDIEYVDLLIQRLEPFKLTRTPEGLAIWLTTSVLFPDAKLPKGSWNHNDPLSSKERGTVAKILRDNGAQSEDGPTGNSTGAAQSSPSFAWSIILSHLYKRHKPSKKSEEKVSDFEKFWLEAVDQGLFAASASTERKSLGLQVVSMGISTAPVQLLHAVFSPNAMRCIINQRAGQDRYLHEAAKGPLSQMVTRSKSDQESIPVMLKGLLSGNGAVDFDRLTKSKTAEDLFARAKDESAKDALTLLQQLSAKPNAEDQPQADLKRRLLADMMLNMARKQQAEEGKDNGSIASLVLSMVPFGYADASAGALKASPPLSEASQEMFRSRLMSCLNHILSARMDTDFAILEKVVEEVKTVDAASKTGLRTKADEEIVNNLETAHKTLKALKKLEQKQKESKKAPLRAFKALYALSILLVYNGEADVVPVLEDLELCYQSWKKSEDASVMLVEILLSFISKPSAVYRKIAQQVFEAFSSQLDAEGLQSMLDILDKSENLSGQQELFEQADDAEEGGESGSDEDASDVEMLDGEGASDVEIDSDVEVVEGSESGSSDEEDSEDEAEADEAADLEDFENKLALALKTTKPTEEDSDFDESDMDDEQMMAIEGHLTTIFTERKKITSNKKKDNKDAKENIVNFKNRVLDLLTIFAKQEHSNKLTLDLVLPMLTLIRTTTSKQISDKAFGLLQQFFGACNKTKKFPEADDASEVLALLHSVHDEIRANASKLHSNACSRSSLFLAKILINLDAKHYSDVADCYNNLQKEWYNNPKSQIQPSVFTEWTSWSITTKKHNN